MTEFSMEGKEVVALTEEHLKQLHDAGYSEIEDVPDRGNIVDGKWQGVALSDVMGRAKAQYEIRVFKKLLETGYKDKLTFVNPTELEEFICVVAKL